MSLNDPKAGKGRGDTDLPTTRPGDLRIEQYYGIEVPVVGVDLLS